MIGSSWEWKLRDNRSRFSRREDDDLAHGGERDY
jgi:hypothetical protein